METETGDLTIKLLSTAMLNMPRSAYRVWRASDWLFSPEAFITEQAKS